MVQPFQRIIHQFLIRFNLLLKQFSLKKKKDIVFSITLEASRLNLRKLIHLALDGYFQKNFYLVCDFSVKMVWVGIFSSCVLKRSGRMSAWLLLFLQYTLWLKGEARCFKNKETTASSTLTYVLITKVTFFEC